MATPLYYPALQWIQDKEFNDRYFIRFGITDIAWKDISICIYLKELLNGDQVLHLNSIDLNINEENLFTTDIQTAKDLAIERTKNKLLDYIKAYQQALINIIERR